MFGSFGSVLTFAVNSFLSEGSIIPSSEVGKRGSRHGVVPHRVSGEDESDDDLDSAQAERPAIVERDERLEA